MIASIFRNMRLLAGSKTTVWILPLLVMGMMTAIMTGCGESPDEPVAEATKGPPRATSVDIYIIEPISLERSIQSTGNIVPYETVQIRSERAGKIVSLNIRESGYVKKGTVVAKIDDSELVAQREKQQVQLAYLRSEVDRGNKLLAIQGITEEEVDRLANQVKTIESDIRILDIQIEKSLIKAPFSGYLGLRQVSLGAYITSADVLIDIQQTYRVKLDFRVAEKYLSEVKTGQQISFKVAGSEEEFVAKVYAFGSEISSSTRTFTVRATVDNPDGKLKPGQFAKVDLVTGSTDEAMMVPTDAVIPILDGKQVYTLRNGRVQTTIVETGIRQSELVEITKGLSMGDSIIVSGLLSISDGTLAKVGDIINTNEYTD